MRLRRELLAERVAARKDSLTGLLNRRGFEEFGTAMLADPARRPFVLVLVDLEKFKQVNETLGEVLSDEVLLAFGRRFADYSKGRVVARLGGSRFAALLTSTIANDGRHYPHARDLERILAEPIWVAGYLVRVNASAGMANVDETTGLTEAVRRAEAIMRRNARAQAALAAKVAEQRLLGIGEGGGTKRHLTTTPVYYRSRVIARHYRR